MTKLLKYISAPVERFTKASLKNALLILAGVALALNLMLEICARHSLIGALVHTVTAPHIFIANVSIIFLMLSLCLFVKRRFAMLTLVSFIWIILGVTNAVLLGFRSSPLSAIDFLIIGDALNVVHTYMSVPMIVLTCVLIAAVIALIVFLFIKCPKSSINLKGSLLSLGGAAVFCAIMVIITSCIKLTSEDFITTYDKKGFAYCFTKSIFVHGVERPDDEDREKKDEFMDKLDNGDDAPVSSVVSGAPNIVVVQLESFFDLNHVKDIELSKNPIPTFTKLKEDGISGFLQVAHIGGGTANIEFEFLTGMNLDHFGLGEYPYTTVLKSRACETLAANLKTLDYSAHAIHNHTATFYGRNTVYPYLGFDTFTPLEMMTGIERNVLTFAKDSVLVDEIRSSLDSTDGKDFVFAVSVEGHGGYPNYSLEHIIPRTEDDVEVYGIEDKKMYYQYFFYANLINSMDRTIKNICDLMEQRGEPYVLVFYGDHLPALSLTNEQLENGDVYQTEYAIKTNIELVGTTDVEDINELDADLQMYQLSAYIQKLCGMSEGDITKLHQHEFESGEVYDDILRTLEYEQLYEKEALYQPVDMTIGTRPVIFESYEKIGNSLYVYGVGFNQYSKVIIDGARRDTTFVDDFTLLVENVIFDTDEVEVAQIADDGTELARAVKEAA